MIRSFPWTTSQSWADYIINTFDIDNDRVQVIMPCLNVFKSEVLYTSLANQSSMLHRQCTCTAHPCPTFAMHFHCILKYRVHSYKLTLLSFNPPEPASLQASQTCSFFTKCLSRHLVKDTRNIILNLWENNMLYFHKIYYMDPDDEEDLFRAWDLILAWPPHCLSHCHYSFLDIHVYIYSVCGGHSTCFLSSH